jgi:hypothetical protein
MNAALFGAQAVHLGAGVLLTGALFLVLLAGPPETDFMRRWQSRIVRWARGLALAALASGVAVLALQAAAFEGRRRRRWSRPRSPALRWRRATGRCGRSVAAFCCCSGLGCISAARRGGAGTGSRRGSRPSCWPPSLSPS